MSTWVPSGTATPGGSGTWDTTSTSWTTTGELATWPNTTSSTAAFDTTSGTVTISGSLVAAVLRFDTAGYLLTGGTLGLGGVATINANTAASGATTIASVIAGSAGLTKQGAGRLVLTGANTYSGSTLVSGGVLQVGSDLPPLMEPVSITRVALPMARPCPLAEA